MEPTLLPAEMSQLIGKFCNWKSYAKLRETCRTFNYSFVPVTFPSRTTRGGKTTFFLPKLNYEPFRYTYLGAEFNNLTFKSMFRARCVGRLQLINYPNVQHIAGLIRQIQIQICLNRNDSEIEIKLLLTGLSRNAPTNIGRINYLVQICRWDDYSHLINNRPMQKLTGDWDARVLEFKKKGLILRHKQGTWGRHGNFWGPLSIIVTITK